jgi:TonB family protein
MECFTNTDRRIPRKELMTGLGASFLVHFLIFSSALICAWVMPHKPLKPPYCTVNLVSLKDIGMGAAEPKGSPKGSEETSVPQEVRSSGKTAGQSPSVAPIKKLTVDDTVRRSEAQIKKIEPKEVPSEPEKSQGLEAIEKNLDKLVAKPKVIPHTSSSVSDKASTEAGNPAPAPSPAPSQRGNEKAARGSPNGSVDAGAKGAAQGSVYGSPDGSGALSAASQLYYERVRNAIRQEFKLPDQDVGNLETSALIVVNRNGQVLSLHIEKPSGNGLLDAAAVRAIQNANIPAMPQVMERPQQDFRLKFSSRGVS